MRSIATIIFVGILYSHFAFAYNWIEGEELPESGTNNPYELSSSEIIQFRKSGLIHALHWPVEVTGALIPIKPVEKMMSKLTEMLGIQFYPKQEREQRDAYYVPFKVGHRSDYPMGLTVIPRGGADGVTYSCAVCHAASLFGRPVMGLTNRFPGSNKVVHTGVKWATRITPEALQVLFGLNHKEREQFRGTQKVLAAIEAKVPVLKGLDTSLAHVALSLSHRAPDRWATPSRFYEENPRPEKLRKFVAASKPMVWWNVKYKNRWLADGSVVSGNPILTNLFWNEIGRGTDLLALEKWLDQNSKIIEELTTAVYQTVPPRITDFVPAERISIESAIKGEVLFNNKCARCHGHYEKAWSQPGSENLPLVEQLRTVRVRYFSKTPVKDVGTDPNRYLGMTSLEQMNRLAIMKKYGVFIRPQVGYVPPPLEGIWARYPYLHNNSIPNLCDLLKPAEARVRFYWSGAAIDIDQDFDMDCNGYPIGMNTPKKWQTKEYYFDTQLAGLRNTGHDFGFAKLSAEDRKFLIRFLQTL